MQREMRRKDRRMSLEMTQELLERGEYGVLSTVDGGGQPYGVPLSYVALDGDIWFHCAPVGHKLDNLRANARVSFTVVGGVKAVYDRDFTTIYESAVVFGQAARVEDADVKIRALRALCEKYLPEQMEHFDKSIARALGHTDIWRISAEHMSGKAKGSEE